VIMPVLVLYDPAATCRYVKLPPNLLISLLAAFRSEVASAIRSCMQRNGRSVA
jgi:hypothetical protein